MTTESQLTPQQRQDLEELAKLELEFARRVEQDAWWTWVPTPPQERFIRSVLSGSYDETWFLAANRSGKTDAAVWLCAGFMRFGRNNPKYPEYWKNRQGGAIREWEFVPAHGAIVSLDFANSRDVVQPKLFASGAAPDPSHDPFIPDRELAPRGWSVTNQLLKAKNGNTVAFKSADSGAVKIAGRALDYIMYDEEPPKAVYEETTIRIGGGSKLSLFGACTLLPPEGTVGGVSWVYEEKVKPWKVGMTPMVDICTSSIYENPFLLPSEIERLERLYPPGSIQRKIRLEGELMPGMAGQRAYTSFDSRIHVKEIPFELEHRRPIVWFMDFNVEPLCSGIGQRIGPLFRVYKEIILGEGSIDDMVDEFREAIRGQEREIWIYGDASGNHRSEQTKRTDYQLILNGLKGLNVPVKMRVQDKNPFVTDRVNAVNNALKDIRDGSIHIEISNTCTELIADFEGVLRDQKGAIKKTSNRRDPYFRRTHISDAIGYWITFEEPVQVNNFRDGSEKMSIPRPPGYKARR